MLDKCFGRFGPGPRQVSRFFWHGADEQQCCGLCGARRTWREHASSPRCSVANAPHAPTFTDLCWQQAALNNGLMAVPLVALTNAERALPGFVRAVYEGADALAEQSNGFDARTLYAIMRQALARQALAFPRTEARVENDPVEAASSASLESLLHETAYADSGDLRESYGLADPDVDELDEKCFLPFAVVNSPAG